ncbi:unnamed protein product [Heligmosomoides polygyrus]|uniref:Secreted protein n=1 Tax=Heligmosomoides polygyrus TaxID=6339 RepID=A0A183GL12_HELPZ|nr:unnamed protein product [Heligmosomoides polygyrus]
MDALLLLCRVDAFIVRGSGIFVHSVRGCVRDCADCNCVGSAKSLHSVDWEYIVRRFEAASKVSPVWPAARSSSHARQSLTSYRVYWSQTQQH